MLRPLLVFLLCMLVIGCQVLKPTMPELGAGTVTTLGAASRQPDGALRGRVEFGGRSTQATPADLVNGATVSFIDSGSNTVATGKTDAAGAFSLSLGGFVPALDATYVLEAVKGLNAQAPGSSAARFRTILKWNGAGWLSCTNGSLPGSIVINALTTALAVESALDPADVQAADTIGKVNLGTNPATLNGAPTYAGHPDSEINQLAADLLSNLGGNFDPIASVPAILPAITEVSPNSGPINSLVRITGTGFSPTLAGNTVSINGAAANVVLATPTVLVVSVGSGAAPNGAVSVTTGRGTVTGGAFTVSGGTGAAMWIDGFSPSYGRPDTEVTIAGQFPTVGATPSVRFTGPGGTMVEAAVTARTAASLTATVPLGAEPGMVTVQVQGTTSTSPGAFDVWQGELSAFSNVSNPTPLTANYTALGSCDSPTVRWGNYQYIINATRVFMIPLLLGGGVGAVREAGKIAVPVNYTQPAVVGNWLFLLSGYNAGTIVKTIQRAAINPDGTLGPFSVVGSVQTGRYQGRAYAYGTTIYLLPGVQTRSVERYVVDLATGDITHLATFTPSIYGYTSGYLANYALFGVGYNIILMGGYDSNTGNLNKTCYLTINSDNTLSNSVEGPPLPSVMSWPGAAGTTVNGEYVMYLWGGYNGSIWATSASYCYTWKWNGTSYLTGPTTVTSTSYAAGEQLGFSNGNQLYSIGGWNDTSTSQLLSYSTVASDKSTSAWSVMRGSIDGFGAGLRLGDKLWTLGGSNGTNALATTRFRALNSDGTLAGAMTAGPNLNTARYASTAVKVNDSLYVIGGRSTPGTVTPLTSIERATIQPDGTLGAFIPAPQSLVSARGYAGGIYHKGAIYLFGGWNASAMDTVERIPVNEDGTLGAPALLQTRLPEPIYGVVTPVAVGDDVYLVGGHNGYPTGRTIVARFKPDGSLGSFEWGPSLAEKVSSTTVARLGNHLYAIGGYSEAGYVAPTVQRAKFKPDGTLNDWQLYRPGGIDLLPQPHYYQGFPMIRGDDLYLYNSVGVASDSTGMVNAYLRASFR